eukprot:c34_g1_i1.p1 GENE.c34_g1_i1~~c34_g1_i1.p1  ORF type:complete len:505 (-),score=128.97 c34_g1_i1:85-1554(-)
MTLRILLCLCACALAFAGQVPTPKVYSFEQTTDHFNLYSQPSTFPQRVLVHDGDYIPGGPMIFYCGNEGDIWSFYNNTGWAFDVAPTFGALVVFAEHRYYGQTLPQGQSSFQGSNIGLLSIEQALADFALVVPWAKQKFGASDMKVIAIGGSYGGMLAAWFRIKYPHIADMALAASAPLRIVSGKVDRYAFFQAVTQTFAQADENCPSTARSAFSELIALVNSGPEGLDKVKTLFNLCNPITNDQIEHLILWTVNSFTNLAMMDYPYPTDFLAPLPGFPVKTACQLLMNATTLLEGLRDASTLFYGNSSCNDIYQEFVECADQTGCGLGNDGTAWDYQSCAEIIHYPSTNNVTDMFPPRNWTAQDLVDHCQATFSIQPRPTWLQTWFGGDAIANTTSHIIFSNGLLDPWASGGYLQDLSETLVTVIIPEGAHHLDLRGSDVNDPESVIVARQKEVSILKQWLAELNHVPESSTNNMAIKHIQHTLTPTL